MFIGANRILAVVLVCGTVKVSAQTFGPEVANTDVTVGADVNFSGVTTSPTDYTFGPSIGTIDVTLSNPALDPLSGLPYTVAEGTVSGTVTNQPVYWDTDVVDNASTEVLTFSAIYYGDGSDGGDSNSGFSHTELTSPFPSTQLSFSTRTIPQISYPSAATPVSNALSIVIGGANATIAAVTTAKRTTAQIANAAINVGYEVVRPHHEAYKAGVAAERRVAGTMTGDYLDVQQVQRANDKAVYDHYQSIQYPAHLGTLPTGPMQRLTQSDLPFQSVRTASEIPTEEERYEEYWVRKIDEAYRSGAVDVYVPGDIHEGNAAQIIGQDAFSQLDRFQRLGLFNTVFITGRAGASSVVPLIDQVANVRKITFDGTVDGGMMIVDEDILASQGVTFADTVMHELVHASDVTIDSLAKRILDDPNADPELREAARLAHASANISWDAAYFDLFPDILDVRDAASRCKPEHASSCSAYAEYVKYITEFRAYDVSEGNRAKILSVLQRTGLTAAEAETVVAGVMESGLPEAIEDNYSLFLDLLNKGGPQ